MRSILEHKVSPELLEVLVSITELLSSKGFVQHITSIDNYKMNFANQDPLTVVDDILNITSDSIDQCLKLFEVKVVDDTPLSVLYYILDTLFNFQATENFEEIENIIEGGEDTKEVFIEIMTLTTPFEAEDLYIYITSVSKALIESIHEQCKPTNTDEDFVPIRTSDLSLNVLKEHNSPVLEAFTTTPVPRGLPIDTYMEVYEFLPQSMISEGTVQERVRKAFDLCIYAGLTVAETEVFLPGFIEPYLDSLSQSMEVKRCIAKTLEMYR